MYHLYWVSLLKNLLLKSYKSKVRLRLYIKSLKNSTAEYWVCKMKWFKLLGSAQINVVCVLIGSLEDMHCETWLHMSFSVGPIPYLVFLDYWYLKYLVLTLLLSVWCWTLFIGSFLNHVWKAKLSSRSSFVSFMISNLNN